MSPRPALNLFAPRPAAATTTTIRRATAAGRAGAIVIRGGAVMSMDPQVGDFARGDVLVEGKKILAVGPNLNAGGADVIDARGRIVMPGFIDTHHHQFETALRSFLADGILINDGSNSPSGNTTYFEYILLKFAPVYRPQDVYINELFGGLSPARRRRHHGARRLADPSLAAALGRRDQGAVRYRAPRRLRLFRERGRQCLGTNPGNQYPADAPRIKQQWFSSSDQLVHMIMGGEVYLGRCDDTAVLDDRAPARICRSRRTSSRRSASARSSMRSPARRQQHNIGIGSDNLFIHMTGMSDMAWQKVKDRARRSRSPSRSR